MLFYRKRKKIFEVIRYYFILLRTSKIKDNEKIVFFDISNIAINRYLYSFLKMFQIRGYTVYIPLKRNIIKALDQKNGESQITNWLLEENVVKFGMPSNPLKKITGDQLSNDYFPVNLTSDTYHVPMSFYPWFYRNFNYINRDNKNTFRKNSIFMSGNIDPNYYDHITESQYFNIPSRLKVEEAMIKTSYYRVFKSTQELESFFASDEDEFIIMINSQKHFRIDIRDLFTTLRRFKFYFALPGVHIPQCHNIIEAVFCQTIPVIHQEYANTMTPPLENNIHAITYDSIEDLINKLPTIFAIPDSKILVFQKNLEEYYKQNLSPKAITDAVVNHAHSKIYIQAENLSFSQNMIRILK